MGRSLRSLAAGRPHYEEQQARPPRFGVFLGDVAATKLPLRIVRGVCAAVFAVIGVLVLASGAFKFT